MKGKCNREVPPGEVHGSPGVGDGTHGEVLGGGGDYISLGPWGSPIGNLLLPLSCRLFLGHALARGLGSVQSLCGLSHTADAAATSQSSLAKLAAGDKVPLACELLSIF